jgi:hypothetical protein
LPHLKVSHIAKDPQPGSQPGIGYKSLHRNTAGSGKAGPNKEEDTSEPSGEAPQAGRKKATQHLEN